MTKKLFIRPMIPHKSIENAKCYLIVDAAHDKEIFPYFNTQTDLAYKSLFEGTVHIEAARAGPLLVKVPNTISRSLSDKLRELQEQYPAVIWLWSHQDLDDVLYRLKEVLFAEHDNKEVLCRYYDSRCIKAYLSIFSKEQSLDQWRKIIPYFAVWRMVNYEYLETASGKSIQPEENTSL